MRIVVASGKGGTGKTLVSTSLALTAADEGPTALLDADVEAANAGLFVRPRIEARHPVEQRVPHVDETLCQHCGRCAEVCRYNAIASIPTRTLVFGELCHGCGSCTLECPSGAISEVARPVGIVEVGRVEGAMLFGQGTLNVGEAMATPIIRALKRHATDAGWDAERTVIVDAPPGTSCPVVEALRGADVALLVTEPTPFGLHDLRLAAELARDVLGLPVGVVINKDDDGQDHAVDAYCREMGLPVLLRIPLRREIAVAYSRGDVLVEALPAYREPFRRLLAGLGELAGRRVACGS
jgi:MinD superfamily P-loop ATPase